MLLDSGLQFKERRVSDLNKKGNGKKRKKKREGRTYRSSLRRERITHDVRVIGHDTLLSKAIQAISIDYPRDMWWINGLTSSRSPPITISHIRVITNKAKTREGRSTRV